MDSKLEQPFTHGSQPQMPRDGWKLTLLDLSGDLLRASAFWLRPKDRLNFALTCHVLFREIWGDFAVKDLTSRFPMEHRVEFKLRILLERRDQNADPVPIAFANSAAAGSDSVREKYRMVPDRSRQQHVNVAVSPDGRLVAVLPYDNLLRLINMDTKEIVAEENISPMFCYDIWDICGGRREPKATVNPHAKYADEAGLDVEVGLEFSADGTLLTVSGRTKVKLYRVWSCGQYGLHHALDLDVDQALERITGFVNHSRGVGGAAALSPDNKSVAWVVFSGSPASVYVTFWDVDSRKCRAVCQVATIHPRRWSALGWARVSYSPNGQYCILIVNGAKNIVRMARVGEEFQRVKLCRYTFAVFKTSAPQTLSHGAASSSPDKLYARQCKPIRESTEWLELSSDVYARRLASAVAHLLDGLCLYTDTYPYNVKAPPAAKRRQFGMAHLSFSSLHSCPAEATYKALSFGPSTRHPWFVTKQPMFSLHFPRGERILVATSPHANVLQTLTRTSAPNGLKDTYEITPPAPAAPGTPPGCNPRQHAFKFMPWRTSFAGVTAFAGSGRWLAGASLLDGDMCRVCVRNLTLAEYFGAP